MINVRTVGYVALGFTWFSTTLNVIALVTNYWMEMEQPLEPNVHSGILYTCVENNGCQRLENFSIKKKLIAGLWIVGTIMIVVAGILASVLVRTKKTTNWRATVYVAAGTSFGALCCLASLVLYTEENHVEVEENPYLSFDFAFSFGWISCPVALAAAALYIVQFKAEIDYQIWESGRLRSCEPSKIIN